jgi:hypothetical protein
MDRIEMLLENMEKFNDISDEQNYISNEQNIISDEQNYINDDIIFLIVLDKYLINKDKKQITMLKNRIETNKINMTYFNYYTNIFYQLIEDDKIIYACCLIDKFNDNYFVADDINDFTYLCAQRYINRLIAKHNSYINENNDIKFCHYVNFKIR